MDREKEILLEFFEAKKSEIVDHINEASVTKDSKLSEKARKKGNDLLMRGVHDVDIHVKILECYSKSLALAPLDSDQHAFAYGNRSSFLMHLEKYDECIQDIDRALKITDSQHLTIKLLCRKIKCLKILGKSFEDALKQCKSCFQKIDSEDVSKNQSQKFIEDTKQFQPESSPKLVINKDQNIKVLEKAEKNCMNQFDHISIACDKKYGRHLIANRNFKPGEIIFMEDYYTATFFEEKIYLSCANCFQICWTGIPCHQCSEVIYCSEKCKEESWDQYHNIECAILPVLKKSVLQREHSYNLLRMLLMGVKEFGSISNLKRELESFNDSIDSSPDQFLKDGNRIKKTIKNVLLLQRKGIYSQETYWNFCCNALKILFCLIKYTSFFGQSYSLEKIDDLMKNENIFFTCIFLMKLNMIHNINGHRFRLMTDPGSERLYSDFVGVMQPLLLGLMNHSCFPNVYKTYALNKKMMVCAVQPIKKGSQLFECYKSCNFGFLQKKNRQQALSTCHFTCDCLPCLENWPTLQEMVLLEGKKSVNPLDLMSKECQGIVISMHQGKSNYNQTELNILSKNIITSMEKFKQPSALTFMLVDTLRGILSCKYFCKLKNSIFGKCKIMKG